MKYIDAELLRKEIERLEKAAHSSALGCADSETRKFHEGKDYAYQHVGILIDSLQQEQPDFPTTDEQVKEFLATHPKIKVPEKYKSPDWLFKNQEQPEVDLEKEIEEYWIATGWSKVMTLGKFKVIARYFAKWQYQKDRGEFAKIKAKTWCEGFDAHKEQMLKDTIEVTVQSPILGPPMICCIANGCSDGDKVRIVVLKEEE